MRMRKKLSIIDTKPTKLIGSSIPTSKKSSSSVYQKLIGDMREVVLADQSDNGSSSSSSKDLEYIFVKVKTRGRSEAENSLSSFLNEEGIFQINLGVVMKEYSL